MPSAGGGTAASRGSLAMYDDATNGFLYLKSGTADTAWTLMDSNSNDWLLNGNTLGANTSIGSLDNFDQIFIRNNIELMRTVGSTAAVQGLLIGLNASLGGRLQLAPTAAGDDILKEVLSPTSNPVIRVTRIHRLTTVAAASAIASVAIPSDYNCNLEVRAVARQTAGATGAVGDGASYIRTCHASNLAGVVTMFKEQTDYTYEVAGAMNFALTASGANIDATATGSTGRNLSWGVYSQLLLITT